MNPLDFLPYIGLAAACIVVLQSLAGLYGILRRHYVSRQLLQQHISTARTRAQMLLEDQEKIRAIRDLSWDGYRKFKVDRKVRDNVTGSISSFILTPHDGRPLPSYEPGQFLTFQLPITEKGRTTARPIVRCYSLSDAPAPDSYRVTIKRLLPTQSDEPPGLSSNYFHDHVHEGDILDVKAPGGHFYLDMSSNAPVVLIGAGVGITPLLSMVNTVALSGSSREVWVFYGVRDPSEQIMESHLKELATAYPNIHLHICYSMFNPPDTTYYHKGRISMELLKAVLNSSNFQYYLCGPTGMMSDLIDGLKTWGVPDRDIHFEAFGASSVRRVATTEVVVSEVDIPVIFSRSGKELVWDPGAASLLEFAEANGIFIDAGCRVGNCETCLTAIKKGDITYAHEPSVMPDKGSCLMCISIPKSPLTLDA